MADVRYKEYSEEEDKIYTYAITRVLESIRNGMTMEEASLSVDVKEEELKSYIMDDALKVAIAERYFGQGVALEQLSETLKVPVSKLQQALREMLEDVGHTSSEYYRMTHGDGACGNA